MARVTVQQGHCHRTRGATGTWREQELARAIGPRLTAALRDHGHTVSLILADQRPPGGEVFVALHADSGSARVSGPGQSSRRGASVGFPSGDSGRLAQAWKRHHAAQGFPGGVFLPDNYTIGLRQYYGFRQAKGYAHRFLAEHGCTTNSTDERWLFANIDRCVQAHVDAIGEVVGHPRGTPVPEPEPTPEPEPEALTMPLVIFKMSGTDGFFVLNNLTGQIYPITSTEALDREERRLRQPGPHPELSATEARHYWSGQPLDPPQQNKPPAWS